jgi:hypothetical protein
MGERRVEMPSRLIDVPDGKEAFGKVQLKSRGMK